LSEHQRDSQTKSIVNESDFSYHQTRTYNQNLTNYTG